MLVCRAGLVGLVMRKQGLGVISVLLCTVSC